MTDLFDVGTGEVNVIVTGMANSGKSTIAQIIHEALTTNGIESHVHFIHDEHSLRSEDKLQQCIESLSTSKLKVDIHEIQGLQKKHGN